MAFTRWCAITSAAVFVEMEQREDFDAAERLGREFAEDFRLLEDIGWQPNDGRESVALTMPLGELSELLQRLQDEAERLLTESPAERRSREEDEEVNTRFRLGLDACEDVLAGLGSRRRLIPWSPRPRSPPASPGTYAAAANTPGSPGKSWATAPSTRDEYRRLIAAYTRPYFSGRLLVDVTTYDLARFLDWLADKGEQGRRLADGTGPTSSTRSVPPLPLRSARA